MAYTQTKSHDGPLELKKSLTMDRFSGSGSTVDDSPLQTPMDEDVPQPFEAIGQRLKELETRVDPKKELQITSMLETLHPKDFIATDTASLKDLPRQTTNIVPQAEAENTLPQIDSQPQEPDETIASTTADEDSFEFSNTSNSSAISEGFLSSFPAVPFSSPEVPEDSVLCENLPFSSELSRSLNNIQVPSTTSSPMIPTSSPSIDSISPEESPVFNTHSRASSLYNLPNITISPSMVVTDYEPQHHSEPEVSTDSSDHAMQAESPTVLLSNAPPSAKQANDHQTLEKAALDIDLNDNYNDFEYTFPVIRNLDFSLSNLPILLLKLMCFVPWCALVGGTILLFPTHIDQVAFAPGIGFGHFRLSYLSAPAPGIERFAHWAECAAPYIMIFLAAVGVCVWYLATRVGESFGVGLAVALVALVIAQMVLAWQDFDFGVGETGRSDPKALGVDDMESIWVAVKMNMVAEENKMWFFGSLEAGIYMVDKGLAPSSVAGEGELKDKDTVTNACSD